MGIDVVLYAVGEVSDDELAAAESFVKQRCFDFGYSGPDGDEPFLRRDEYEGEQRIEFHSLIRLYSPGYERGHWPDIHNAIVCLRAALPNCKVFYGGDVYEWCPEATDELLTEHWTHWLSPEGLRYKERP